MEIEAKYAIPSLQLFQALQLRESLGDFPLRESRTTTLRDTYLDTPDRALWRAGYSLRRRAKGDALVMTLKALAGGAGTVKRREELEVAIPQPAPPALWDASPARDRVIEIIGERELAPLFELQQARHERIVLVEGRAACVMSLDAVTLSNADRETRFYVLEAELLPNGTEADLANIMRALEESWGLQPDSGTKLQRALDFFELAMPGMAAMPGIAAMPGTPSVPSVPSVPDAHLTLTERAQLTYLAAHPGMYGRRAQALLLLDQGATQIETAERTDMSERRVRYWLAEWRQQRLGIFPEKVLAQIPPTLPAATASPAPTPPPSPAVAAAVATEVVTPKVALEPQATGEDPGDVIHIQAVVERAGALFELLRPWHGLAPEDRPLLQQIAQLHDIGLNLDPENHALAGYERLTAVPPAQFTPQEAQIAGLATLLHSSRLKPKALQALLDRTNFQTLPLEQQHRALVLTALLRMADGLDFRHTGSTTLVALEAGEAPQREILITVAGPVAGSDAERANFKADLWARIFNQPVRFQTPPLNSTELLAHLLHLPAEASASESFTLPATPGIDAGDTLTEAARKIFLFHFQRMLNLEPATRRGEDNEALHDMRVATRRMRTAAQVFAAYLDPETLQPFVKGLRRAGDTLGAVRDLDVFWEKTEVFLNNQVESERPDLTPLHRVWQNARDAARERLLKYLDSSAYRRFRGRFAAHLESAWAPPFPPFNAKGEALPQQVRHVAPILVAERIAAIRAYDPWIRGADVPLGRYHRLRIASKRLRYTLEYFSEVLGPAAKPLITQVKLLQDHLGELQDAVVASNLLRDFLVWGTWGHTGSATVPLEPVIAPGVALYLTERQLELQQRRDSFLPLWENFNSAEVSGLIANVITAL